MSCERPLSVTFGFSFSWKKYKLPLTLLAETEKIPCSLPFITNFLTFYEFMMHPVFQTKIHLEIILDYSIN